MDLGKLLHDPNYQPSPDIISSSVVRFHHGVTTAATRRRPLEEATYSSSSNFMQNKRNQQQTQQKAHSSNINIRDLSRNKTVSTLHSRRMDFRQKQEDRRQNALNKRRSINARRGGDSSNHDEQHNSLLNDDNEINIASKSVNKAVTSSKYSVNDGPTREGTARSQRHSKPSDLAAERMKRLEAYLQKKREMEAERLKEIKRPFRGGGGGSASSEKSRILTERRVAARKKEWNVSHEVGKAATGELRRSSRVATKTKTTYVPSKVLQYIKGETTAKVSAPRKEQVGKQSKCVKEVKNIRSKEIRNKQILNSRDTNPPGDELSKDQGSFDQVQQVVEKENESQKTVEPVDITFKWNIEVPKSFNFCVMNNVDDNINYESNNILNINSTHSVTPIKFLGTPSHHKTPNNGNRSPVQTRSISRLSKILTRSALKKLSTIEAKTVLLSPSFNFLSPRVGNSPSKFKSPNKSVRFRQKTPFKRALLSLESSSEECESDCKMDDEEVKTTQDATTAHCTTDDMTTVDSFAIRLQNETQRLNDLCVEWESKLVSMELNAENSSDVVGLIRSTIGKTRLLLNKKGRFEQMKSLIHNCKFNIGEKKTKVTDLQGFWDLIFYQVENIIADFDALFELEKNEWSEKNSDNKIRSPLKSLSTSSEEKRRTQESSDATTRPKTKKGVRSKKLVSNNKNERSTALKQMMMAKKRELGQSSTRAISMSNDVENKDPQNLNNDVKMENNSKENPKFDEKVFEGGFFSIATPSPSVSQVLMLKAATHSRLCHSIGRIEKPKNKTYLSASRFKSAKSGVKQGLMIMKSSSKSWSAHINRSSLNKNVAPSSEGDGKSVMKPSVLDFDQIDE